MKKPCLFTSLFLALVCMGCSFGNIKGDDSSPISTPPALITPEPTPTIGEYVEISDKYLIGFDYSSYASVFGTDPVVLPKVCYDKTFEVTFSWTDEYDAEYSETRIYTLTDEQYNNIIDNVDPQEVYYIDPECSDPDDVCDGGSIWLFVYGPDDEILKRCGGFCPDGKRFNEIRRTLFDNLPEDFISDYDFYEENGYLQKEVTEQFTFAELDADANRAMIAEALDRDVDDRKVKNIEIFLESINAGNIQSATLSTNESDTILDVVGEDGTHFRVYMTKNYSVYRIENVTTGEYSIETTM